jgi:hypothetical protein
MRTDETRKHTPTVIPWATESEVYASSSDERSSGGDAAVQEIGARDRLASGVQIPSQPASACKR